MKIAVGCDHGGFELKQAVIKFLTDNGYGIRISVPMIRNPAIIPILRYQWQKQWQRENLTEAF